MSTDVTVISCVSSSPMLLPTYLLAKFVTDSVLSQMQHMQGAS